MPLALPKGCWSASTHGGSASAVSVLPEDGSLGGTRGFRPSTIPRLAA